MKILTISNYYPPHYIGGYELACQCAVDALRQRGHEVRVLTSMYGVAKPCVQESVYRWLRLHPYAESPASLYEFAKAQYHSIRNVRCLIRRFQPDIVYVWSMGLLGHPLIEALFEFQAQGCPLVFAISDRWMFEGYDQSHHWRDYWQHLPGTLIKKTMKRGIASLISRVISVKPLTYPMKYAHFFSASLQWQYAQAGIFSQRARIIYHGVPIPSEDDRKKTLKLNNNTADIRALYSGRIDPQKGVHTAIEAMAELKKRGITCVRLTIIGKHEASDYLSSLFELIERHALQETVFIKEKVPREALDDVYDAHDLLLFPSIWEEPFSITLLEAMAHGLVVIATATGGSSEILNDQENCLTFTPEGANDLAAKIEKIIEHPELGTRLKNNAIATIRSRFSFEGMMQQIEHYLQDVLRNHSKI